jgi:hypothetical protein
VVLGLLQVHAADGWIDQIMVKLICTFSQDFVANLSERINIVMPALFLTLHAI